MTMKQVKITTGESQSSFQSYKVSLFFGAVVIAFLFTLSTYETPNFAEEKPEITNIPSYGRKSMMSSYKVPEARVNSRNSPVVKVHSPSQSEKNTEGSTLNLWKEPTLLNITSFSWKMNNKNLCQIDHKEPRNDSRLLILLVHSARPNFIDRLTIRRTWGAITTYKNWHVRFVFLLGEEDRQSDLNWNEQHWQDEQTKLVTEQAIFEDLVVGSFIDSYHNLTYKHLMGYKWVLNFCREATFVIKSDDDILLDIMQWLDMRTGELANYPLENIPDLYCRTFKHQKPVRSPDNKWYVSEQEWPDTYYPAFCSGWVYGITVDLIEKLYSVSNDVKYHWIDVMFVTGALMEVAMKKYGLKPNILGIWKNVTNNITEYRDMCDRQTLHEKRLFKAAAVVPRGDYFERDMMCMWNKILRDKNLQMRVGRF